MSYRFTTPIFHEFDPVSSYGVDTTYPFTFGLSSEAGYREFDVVIAAMYRITRWRVQGEIAVSGPFPDSSSTDFSFASSLDNPTGFGTPGDFAAFLEDGGGGFSFGNFMYAGFVDSGYEIEFPAPESRFEIKNVADPFAIASLNFVAVDEFPPESLAPHIIVTARRFGVYDNECGDLTISVPGWRGVATHSITTPLYSDNTIDGTVAATFTMEGDRSITYDGIWEELTALNLLDPVTTPD